ncbi:hypothetical protein ASJ81_14025 [Methanosarcina spelaei]|uniref:Glycosyltransferase 2-like domain-containing protein n=1 Tax=Methanosarcina spelaei TaxID=1036679 RepID=A0A2A2HYJ8_9EURY|nr:glycosyltransferase family A protein [Methanosarcina spelaei]PAV14384.1 hypothetical protein ASJ81_14025 [Methanosarcina spelaei]
MPLVSVVIPLYNKELYVSRALYSVLNQTFQEFEIIIIDDGSTDKSAEVVKNFVDPRIRLIHQENGGVSAARNKGIEKAKANLIAFLDADDEWTPSFLETILRLRKKYPEAGAYATAYKKRYPNMNEKKLNFFGLLEHQKEGLLTSYFKSATKGKLPVRSSNVAIPKNVFYEVGKFPIGEWWGEDTDMWGRIALKFPIAFSMDICSVYNIDTLNSASKTIMCVQEHPFIKTAREAIRKNEVSPDILEDLYEYLDKEWIVTAKRNLLAENAKLSRMNLYQCTSKKFDIHKELILLQTYLPQKVYSLKNKVISKIYEKI